MADIIPAPGAAAPAAVVPSIPSLPVVERQSVPASAIFSDEELTLKPTSPPAEAAPEPDRSGRRRRAAQIPRGPGAGMGRDGGGGGGGGGIGEAALYIIFYYIQAVGGWSGGGGRTIKRPLPLRTPRAWGLGEKGGGGRSLGRVRA